MADLSFDDQMASGRPRNAEIYVGRVYERLEWTVEDVAEDPEWQNEGVDLIIQKQYPSGHWVTKYVDVKLESYLSHPNPDKRSDAAAFELIEQIYHPDKGRAIVPGWGLKQIPRGREMFVTYVDRWTKEVYELHLGKLQNWAFQPKRWTFGSLNPKKYRSAGLKIPRKMLDDFKIWPPKKKS